MRPTQLLATIASFSALTQAWPWPDTSEPYAVIRRQDSSSTASETSNSATTTAKTSSQTGKTTSATNTKSQSITKTSGTESGSSASASATDGGKSDSGNSTAAATTSFDAGDGMGSVVMVTPSALAGSTYYKVGDYVTWGWNYTMVQATPTAIDLWAYCSAAKATYTLAMNMTYDEKGKFTWDTAAYATQAPQLGTNSYTLSIADAEIGMSGTKGAGYLNPVAMYTFAMYTPQPYVNYTSWTCATCNSGAASLTPKNTWSFLGGMASITVLSFTWFATGRFGIL